MKMKPGRSTRCRSMPSPREHRARSGSRNRRSAARPDRRDLRPGVVGQDDAGAAHRRRGQKLGGLAAIIDAEHALDPVYAGRLGVNLEELLISQPDTEGQALEMLRLLSAPARSTSS